jgi:hypothetical protein
MPIPQQIKKEICENPENYLFGFFLLGFNIGGLLFWYIA